MARIWWILPKRRGMASGYRGFEKEPIPRPRRTAIMSTQRRPEHIETLVVGGGQAGLSVGYHLSRRGMPFLIVDASERVGNAWRNRWDSLRLFTPAKFNGLDGMPFPEHRNAFPTKDQMADYLEGYAAHFDLPIRSGVRVERLTRRRGRLVAETTEGDIEADNVVVAMSSYQEPRVPAFAGDLKPSIRQMHSSDYRNPDQLRPGPVLLVGAGNSGSEIALELAKERHVWLSGRDVGEIPFRPRGFLGLLLLVRLVLRLVYHRILTVRTPIGRKVRPKVLHKSGPLIRVKRRDLARAGVERVPRTMKVEDGLPALDDGRVLEPANLIWCTGFEPDHDWIDLPSQSGPEPSHESGTVPNEPGLYFVGLHFLHALSSDLVHGVGRDAERIVRVVAERRERSVDDAALRAVA
jgi:putative flavoprotein involved in K+ transport